MRIVRGKCVSYVALSCVEQGQTLRFRARLAQKHQSNDIFIIVEVCDSYRPADYRGVDRYAGKVPVVNLRTGALAYVANARPCYRVNAECLVEEG